MTWLVWKKASLRVWLWLKEHWQVPFLVAWTLLVWVLTRRNTQSIVDVLEARKKSYEEQLRLLETTHRDELLKRDGLLDQYRATLKKTEQEFKKREMDLSEKEKEIVKKIVIESKGDPDAVKKEIEAMFSFDYAD